MRFRFAPAILTLASVACSDPGSGRPGTVLFASGADLQSMNPLITIHPLAKQVQRYVFLMTLVRYDSLMQVEPYLARSWEWSDDRRELTMYLSSQARWHDGTPTTARDAAWTLNAARDPATGYPRQQEVATIDSAIAVNDTTLLIRFQAPEERIPDVLTDLAIAPSSRLDTVPRARMREAQWNRNPVGNGPFRFVSHDANRSWIFVADSTFPEEFGGPPLIDRLVIAIVDEPVTKLAALTAGELDFAGINPAHASFVRDNPDLRVINYPLIFTYGIVLNTRQPPFDDYRVRKALSVALDRQEIVEGYLYGFGVPARGPVPPELPGAIPVTPAPPDPGKARELLGGRTIEFDMLTVGSGEAALEQMIQAQLAPAGFDVNIRQMELSAFLDRVYSDDPDFTAAVLGIPGDPGLAYLGPLARLAGMTAPEDPVEAQRFFLDSLPVAFIYHATGVQGANRRVRGVRMDLRGELPSVTRWTTR